MRSRHSFIMASFVVALLMPGVVFAQTGPWFVVGGGSTSILGDCTTCENTNYPHTGDVLFNGGVALSPRLDFGGELFWVPSHLASGEDLRVTYLMPVVQFRPWGGSGFFVKAGAGFAFVRNWVVDLEGTGEAPPFISTAFGLAIGAGWEWRTRSRFGVQIFGSQHVAALGDLNTGTSTVDNVIGNFWSAGGAFVIR